MTYSFFIMRVKYIKEKYHERIWEKIIDGGIEASIKILIRVLVKAFRIIPEFRILRLSFHNSQPQNTELVIIINSLCSIFR